MTDIKDGGPAFPVEVDSTQPHGRQTGNSVWQAYGISMRDYFAIRASEDEIERHKYTGRQTETVVEDGNGAKRVKRASETVSREQARYRFADAMLCAREVNHG